MISPEVFPASTLRDEQLKQLLAAWNLIKGHERLPMHPADILRYLTTNMSKLVLMDVEEGGAEFRFRLVGENVFPGLPEFLVSRSVREHPDDSVRLTYTTLLMAAYSAAEPIRGVAATRTLQEKRSRKIESLWLPFGRESKVEQILSLSAEPNAR